MAGEAPDRPWSEILRPLDEVGQRRRDGVKRIGRKAHTLARLKRLGIPVPRGWVLDARWFDEFLERHLPRGHDMSTLVKLSGTRVGDERCARAYEELLTKPLAEDVVAAIAGLWTEQLSEAALGVAVRPSLAAEGAFAGAAMRHLHSLVGLGTPEQISEAVRRVWASSVLSCAVQAYAEADLRAVSMAVIVQEAVSTEDVGLLTRTTGPSASVGAADWHLGVLLQNRDEPRQWLRRAQLLLPLSIGEGSDEQAAAPLIRMREALEPRGFERLAELGTEGEKELGKSAVFHFAVGTDEERTVHVLNADESPRWQALTGGDESTTWVEITMGGRAPEPPTRLSQSVVDQTIETAVGATLESLRCKIDSNVKLMSRWSGRSYLNLNALVAAVTDVPLLTPEDVLYAVGGVSSSNLRALAGRAASVGRSRWRMPLIGTSALTDQITLASDISQLERAIEKDARSMGDMDLTLLPSDAMATTLVGAQALLERCAELWCKTAAGQMLHMLAMRALIRRRVPDVDPNVGYALCRGVSGLFTTNLASHTGRAIEELARDRAGASRLTDPLVVLPTDLPDGRARGALGQLLARYGDVAFGAFELSAPRWREDARELMRMTALLLEVPTLMAGEDRQRQARVAADAELARYEPELSGLERRLLRGLVDRCKELAHRRATIDMLLYRALALVRHVVKDIDRRLSRIDKDIPERGAFHCSAPRLVRALKSGRPELARIIRMRVVERVQHSIEPAPPISFVASPPRGGIPLIYSDTLEGIGVSPGVAEGRVRITRGVLPSALEAGDILVVTSFEPALAPLCLMLGGVISEAGGALSLGAEAARELAVPAVMSVANAALQLQDGERVRIDGTRGTVQRLGSTVRRLSSVPHMGAVRP